MASLLSGTLPTAPAAVAQDNVNWYKPWKQSESVSIGDRRAYDSILYEVYAPAGDNLYPPQPGSSSLEESIPGRMASLGAANRRTRMPMRRVQR
ncbi:MAG: hypothetical protein HFE73_10245 [Firmicutes bacterium]|jgi:hypothetical protein|nr:hypothetical protein [Bacillota bacterium]